MKYGPLRKVAVDTSLWALPTVTRLIPEARPLRGPTLRVVQKRSRRFCPCAGSFTPRPVSHPYQIPLRSVLKRNPSFGRWEGGSVSKASAAGMRRSRLQGRIHADFAFEPPFLSNVPIISKTRTYNRSISQIKNDHYYSDFQACTPRQMEPAGLIRETFFL